MYTLINGSPKPKGSNSLYFLKNISSKLNKYKIYELKKNKYEEILKSINESDTIIFSFPLYVDSPTSIVLSFLDYIIDRKIKLDDKLIYIVINCGFREGKQNITAINIMKRWCEKVNAIYNGSIMIGAGEIIGKEKYKFISRKALKKLRYFTNAIKLKEKSADVIVTMDLLNNKLYCYMANLSWNKKGKLNNLSESDLKLK
ncbi:MAG: flavodoxin family protein [Bacilli bacterium]|nr:flavodoxin family protein [Bacilli bacterium]